MKFFSGGTHKHGADFSIGKVSFVLWNEWSIMPRTYIEVFNLIIGTWFIQLSILGFEFSIQERETYEFLHEHTKEK